MANVVYLSKTLLTGGTAPALDSIDGSGLVDGDFAHVNVADVLYIYRLNATSGAGESSPTIIAPDTNAGTKRWILRGVNANGLVDNSLTASLPLFSGASKELVSKSVADTRTALGLAYDSILPWTINIDVFMTSKSNVNWNTNTLASIIHGGDKRSSGAQNDSIAWDVVLAAGTWNIELLYRTGTVHGIYSVQFDSTEKGTIDGYVDPGTSDVRSSVTGIVVSTTAKIELKLKMATKNGSSNNYYGILQSVRCLRTV